MTAADFDYGTETWMEQAACIGYDPAWWFVGDDQAELRQKALKICRACPVREACLEYALRSNAAYGIWGATSQDARIKLRAKMRKEKRNVA